MSAKASRHSMTETALLNRSKAMKSTCASLILFLAVPIGVAAASRSPEEEAMTSSIPAEGSTVIAPPALVPLGAVLDWWQFSPVQQPPAGYAICDGTVITDRNSPFWGAYTPDLSGKFVMGTADANQIGNAGGASTIDLAHAHGMSHTHGGTTGSAEQSGSPVLERINTGSGDQIASRPIHTHTFYTGLPDPMTTDFALGTVETLPPYVTLLKIMRIR